MTRREWTLRDRSQFAYFLIALGTMVIIGLGHLVVLPAVIEILLGAALYWALFWAVDKFLFRPSKDD